MAVSTPARVQHLQLLGDGIEVDYRARAEQVADARVKDAAGHQVQGKTAIVVDDRVPGIITALKADHHVGPGSQIVYDAALALVAPLGADDHSYSHTLPPLGRRTISSQ